VSRRPAAGRIALLLLSTLFLQGQDCGGGGGDASTSSTTASATAGATLEVASDADGDQVSSFCDVCLDVPNRDQLDTDGDRIGNACDCDFDNDPDGYCNSSDANIFLADYLAGTDSGAGTDMNGDGVVDDADFEIFDPMFADNATGAARVDPPPVVSGFLEGPCWDDRVNRVNTGGTVGDGSSDGCSVPADQVSVLEALGLPPGGNLNNPTHSKVFEDTGGLVSCPNAAFATFPRASDGALAGTAVCGVDVSVDVCTSARAGLPCAAGYCKGPDSIACGDCPSGTRCYSGGSRCNPDPSVACSSNSDCSDAFGEDFTCETDFRCGDLEQPLACEKHDDCGAVCGYRTYACNDQFLLDMVATCNALEGLERQYCRDDCLVFANAYYESVALEDDQVFRDDGTWLPIDYQGDASESGDCVCCDPGDPGAGRIPAVCGDGVCEPPVESCRAPDCPEDCGVCGLGDACLQDEDCPGLACLPNGRCGRLPAGSECSSNGMCRSGDCGLVTCNAVCGDGFCDGTEVCGNASPFSCFGDCGTCGLGQACTADSDCASSDTCLLGTCAPKLPEGSPCESDNDCQNGDCELFTCGGVKCLTDSECSGLGAELCVAGFCLPAKLPNNQPCVRNAMCQSGVCNLGLCKPAGSVAVGGVCSTDAACSSGDCVAGICAAVCGDGTCSPPQEICGYASSGLDCNADCGKCNNGLPCNSDGDCKSGNCVLAVCVADCKIIGASCSSDGDCCGENCVDLGILGKRCD
jgi:hypothetical protein